jgi:integrase/recombinase XerD
MAITIKFAQLKRKRKEDGTIPIYLRFTENRKSKYRSTEISVPPDCFTKDVENPINVTKSKKGYDFFKRVEKNWNHKLRKLRTSYIEKRDDLELRGEFSLDRLLRELEERPEKKESRGIAEKAYQYRATLKSDNRYWEHRHFKVVIGNIENYIRENSAASTIDEMDAAWIEGLQSYLQTMKDENGEPAGNSPRTVRKKLQRVKGMTDWLIKSKQIKHHPFLGVDKVKPGNGDTKTKLTFDQIRAIEKLELEPGTFIWHVRNYFMYSFYNAGIRFGDLATLQWQNIIDGRLVYTMHKTGGQKSIGQLEPMQEILELYRKPDTKPTDLIFPILDKVYADPMELRKKIGSKNAQINLKLKDIAEAAGIQANVSFHVSRHSWAHFSLTKGMDLYSISKALGHSDLAVTQDYLKSFDEELLDKSMKGLYG